MAILNVALRANQASTLPALLVAEYIRQSESNAALKVHLEDVDMLKTGDGASIELVQGSSSSIFGCESVTGELLSMNTFLQGKNAGPVGADLPLPDCAIADRHQVTEWLGRVLSLLPADVKAIEEPLLELDSHLTIRTFLVGYKLTVADLVIWGAIRGNKIANAWVKKATLLNVTRWFKYIEETNPWVTEAVQALNAHAHEKKAAKSKEGGSFEIALPDTAKGVITRFPPEPSYVALKLSIPLPLLTVK